MNIRNGDTARQSDFPVVTKEDSGTFPIYLICPFLLANGSFNQLTQSKLWDLLK